MSTKPPIERSRESLSTRHDRAVKAAQQRLREVEGEGMLQLFPMPYVSINKDGSQGREVYTS
jgi:hypothetical protein